MKSELKRYSTQYCTSVRLLLNVGSEKVAKMMGYSAKTLERKEKQLNKDGMNNTKKRFEILYSAAIDKLIKESDYERQELIRIFTEQYYELHPEEA